MTSFKDIAYQILKKSDRPLHSEEITEIAIRRRLLKTSGKTPEATMAAVLYTDIKKHGKKSRFLKTAPSTFTLNPKCGRNRLSELPKKKKTKLVRLPSEEFVKNSLIKWFSENGWKLKHISGLKGKGVDIKAQKGGRYFFVEVKGSRNYENDFVCGLGQIISRMKVVNARYAYNYGLALPSKSAKIAVRRLPWKVAQKLTLYIFSVDETGQVRRLSCQDMRKEQRR